MRRKFLRLQCVLYAVLCLLATSCGAAPAFTSQPQLPASLQEMDFSEHFTISIGFWNLDAMTKNQPDALLSYLEELFNITVVPVSFRWADYQERQQVLAATGNLPDVTATLTSLSSSGADAASLEKLIRSGALRSLPEDLSSFPLVNQSLLSFRSAPLANQGSYCLPRTSFQDPVLGSSDAAMIVRKDWLESLGLSEPQNLEDFIAMTQAFAKEDPDGNGKNDTAGYNVNTLSALGKWLILSIAPECNVFSYTLRDGQYVPSYILPEFTNVVQVYQTLFRTGGLDPLFYAKKSNDAVTDFCAGRLGALEYKSSASTLLELQSRWELYQEKPFEDCVSILNIFPAPDGVRYSNSSSAFWSETVFSSKVNDAKMQRILCLFEYLLSEEGILLTRYGIPEVDYTVENDTYECLLDTSTRSLSTILQEKYPSLALWASLASWGGTWTDFSQSEQNYLQYGKTVVDLSSKALAFSMEQTTLVERPYDFYLFPQETVQSFNTERALNAFVTAIISPDDGATVWNNFVQTLYEEGLQEYLDTLNKNYAAALANHIG